MAYAWDTEDNQYDIGEKLTWKSAVELFLEAKRVEGRTKKVLYTYRNVLERVAQHATDQQMPLQRFGVRAMQGFLSSRRTKDVGDRTIQQDATVTKTFFTWLWQEEYFPQKNLERLKTPAVRKYVRPRIAPTTEEIRTLVAEIDRFWSDEHNPSTRFRSERVREFFRSRDKAIVLIMADTGMRISEVLSIKLENVELGSCRITLEQTKNGTTRQVPISAVLVQHILAPWLELRKSLKAECDRLFISELGGPLHGAAWGRQLTRKRELAGITRNLTCHTFRRYASTLHDQVDRDAAKAIVGHHSDDAHKRYNVQEWTRLLEVHEEASPLNDILNCTDRKR